ncbi:MAG TPA: class I SAM-dependent DNA methyltransferase [Candidatus Dormibacteraeota bacterium]|nr:class I SAM-dependent DNA methyltransferase [Candidatus Dormibacteraeota bacterium]
MTNNQNTSASGLIQRVWSYAHVLKDDGLAFMDYTEQITYLLFLKMIWEQRFAGASEIPSRYTWGALKDFDDNAKRLARYHQALRKLSEFPGLIGLIFTKPQSKINDPAKLHLLIQMIDNENWSELDLDVKGEVYEGLLARNADDVRGGAGQYFTPRPVIRAIVEVMRPEPMMRISDPACGTGGFLLAAFEYLRTRTANAKQDVHLRTETLHGVDLVPNVARLCAMNLFLHGIGTDHTHPVISIADSLESKAEPVDMVLTNPPFGKKSSFTIIGAGGKKQTDKISYEREDFWATTSNKQLNFVQHVHSMLKEDGRAAVVVPDNVLFEGGAGEKIRRALLQQCEVHTLLRLPTGIWYSPGVKANVLFFDKKPEAKTPATKEIWVYDLRSERSFSLRQNPISTADLTDFIHCYHADDRTGRTETAQFRRFTYAEIIARDKANLDLQWQQEATNTARSETPQALMKEILKDLEEAMREFAAAESEIQR